MSKNDLQKKSIKLYFLWPLIFSIASLVLAFILFLRGHREFKVVYIFAIVVTIISVYLYFFKYRLIIKRFFTVIYDNPSFQTNLLYNHKSPYALCSKEGKILWENKAFSDLLCEVRTSISDITKNIPKINSDVLYKGVTEGHEMIVDFGNSIYHIGIYPVTNDTCGIYFTNITELEGTRRKYEEEKNVMGLIYIDNYEEAIMNIEDSNIAIVNALVDRKITRYVSNKSGIVKKIEKDKYLLVANKQSLKEMIQDKFSIVNEVREINAGNDIYMTLSIGIGVDGKSIEENYDFARLAIDMALGRGGDQTVVKTNIDMQYFGGNTSQQEKFTRVRSRVKAKSFREVLDTKDRVLIVGHKKADFDTFGAAIGIYVMANFLAKDTHIVINSIMDGVADVKKKFDSSSNYPNDMFIDGNEALMLVDENTILVMVDHNNPIICDEPRLIEKISSKVVIDHHRKNEYAISDTVLQHVEPNASSASELVCEMLEYFDDKLNLKSLEAESLLLGIVVDTNYFTNQTSAKTFDAASYLKKNGADMAKIRNVLKISSEEEILKNKTIQNVHIYNDGYAIAAIERNDNVDTKLVAAETANELIHVKGIRASIVIVQYETMIAISARSIDQVNVQVLMEKLGGGGHKSQAACQLHNTSIEEAIQLVEKTIDEMEAKEKVSDK